MLKWMQRRLKQSMMQQDGLTLIELIVVVAIIAVLAFTITPRVLDSLNTSRVSSARSVANEIHAALERYAVNQAAASQTAQYPSSHFAGGADQTFATLRTNLASVVGLSNNADSVFATTPPFAYRAYRAGDPGTYTPVSATADVPVGYCIIFQARDSGNTQFRITPAGVQEGASVTPCPIDANSALN